MTLNKIILSFTLFYFFMIAIPIRSNAEIYMWTDEKGQKYFSNIAPEGQRLEKTLKESVTKEAFDPSMNAVPEEEVRAFIEEAEARQKKIEEERKAEEKRQIEAKRKAEEERRKQEIERLKRRLRREQDYSRRLRYKIKQKEPDL